jgi:hypothetical protein
VLTQQQESASRTTPTYGGVDPDAMLVYHPGETPAWKEECLPRQRQPTSQAGWVPFASILRDTSEAQLIAVRRRVSQLSRAELIQRYRAAYVGERRLVGYIMASELIGRGIPPCFWHEMLALEGNSVAQREMLTLADLAWLRCWHRHHATFVRYQRGRALLTGNETTFLREAQFAFHEGKRPPWKIVSSLSMTTEQQWSAYYLRSTPVKREALITEILGKRVLDALDDAMRITRKTVSFTDADAGGTLERRYMLWRCSRMVKSGSPTEIATRYQQMSGLPITRQTVAKQLGKVEAILRKKGADYLN